MYENRRIPDASEFLFSFKLHVALRKCSRSQDGTSGKNTSHFPVFPGANPKPRLGIFPPPPHPPAALSFRLTRFKSKWPGACLAAPRPSRGRGPGAGGPAALPETAGNFPPPPRETMPGGRPTGGPRSLPGKARGATGRPPSPHRVGAPQSGPPEPAPSPRPGRPAGGRSPQPAPRGRLSRLRGRAGGRGRRRAPRNSPGPGGRLGIIPWLARAAALSRARAALGTEGGRRPGEAGRAGGTGAAAAAAARRGSRARRRKGRATMCRGEEAAAARAARTLPLGGGGRGLQEIPTLRQEIGILTKHSRPGGRSAPGAPASLNPWPAGTGRGGARRSGPGSESSRSAARPEPRRPPPAPGPEVERPGCARIKPWPWQGPLETPGEGLVLSRSAEHELTISRPVPLFSIREMTLPGCPFHCFSFANFLIFVQ